MTEPQNREGEQFGNYRLEKLLGRGGFAEVYLGQHMRLQRPAAIKILRTVLSEREIDDFQQEARIIAALDHPNIVRVLDFDVQQGVPFLVMDYLPHGTLRQRYQRGERVPLPTVVSYVQQVASALQYAHDQKLIHRDIKPENMLIGRRNEIVLSDFGIAAIAHSTSSMTAQASVGTVPYMAPEQIQAQARTASDQYALGIVTYEWLSGERPFTGSFTEIFGKHLMTPPPPLRPKLPTLSADVEQVVLTTLAKDPQQRFRSVQAFAVALATASHDLPKTSETGEGKTVFAPWQPSAEQPRPATPAPINITNTPTHTPTIANTPAAHSHPPLSTPRPSAQAHPSTSTPFPAVQPPRSEGAPVRKRTLRNIFIGLGVGVAAYAAYAAYTYTIAADASSYSSYDARDVAAASAATVVAAVIAVVAIVAAVIVALYRSRTELATLPAVSLQPTDTLPPPKGARGGNHTLRNVLIGMGVAVAAVAAAVAVAVVNNSSYSSYDARDAAVYAATAAVAGAAYVAAAAVALYRLWTF